jgi:D-alanyl-D-alanine dipeptidase
MMRAALLALALTLATGCAASTADNGQARPPEFVDVARVVPGLVVDMRYAGSRNFVGRPIAGYEAPVCLLTRQAAEALAAVQRDLAASGRGLKVYDCYRPARAVADFAAWARDLDDQRSKPEYYPNVPKDQLFALGYIAERSGHSRGSTVDVTLVDLATGAELDMGTPYDLFDRCDRFNRGAGEPARPTGNHDRPRLPAPARGMVALYAERGAISRNLFRLSGAMTCAWSASIIVHSAETG